MTDSTDSETAHGQIAKQTLVLLTLLNFFNYADRQAVYALFPLIGPEFQLNDKQLGMLATSCLLVLAIAAVPGGWVADRVGARIVITAGAVFWSIATAVSSFTRSFTALLTARAAVGIGEASYEPAAHATLCALFPARKAQVLGIFNVGTALGVAGGMAIAGFLGSRIGWRHTILLMALPGVLLAALSWQILGRLPVVKHQKDVSLRDLTHVSSPTLVLVIIGGTLAAFTAGGLQAWMPTFVVRYHGFSLAEAGIVLGAEAIACGAAGVLSGGYLADRFEAWGMGGRCTPVAIAFLLGTPIGIAATFAEGRLSFMVLMGLTIFVLSFYAGPIIAIIDDVVPRRYAATAQAAFLLVSHLLGDTWAPTAVGAVADTIGGKFGLRQAVLLPVFTSALAGIVFALAASRHKRDRARAREMDRVSGVLRRSEPHLAALG